MRYQHVFMWQSLEILNDFNTFTLKQILWKTQTLFKKLEYCFLVESTKIDNITFPYKTALSEANVKTNRMGSKKQTYHINGVFPVTTFLFRKFCFRLGTLYIELIWCTNNPDVHIHTFRKRWSFTLGCFYPVSWK